MLFIITTMMTIAGIIASWTIWQIIANQEARNAVCAVILCIYFGILAGCTIMLPLMFVDMFCH